MCKCIETVFQLAVASFSKSTPSEAAKRNLELLIAQTNKLLSSDVGLESCSVFRPSSSRHHGRARTEARPPPVTYIPVAENKHISMGIFVIREGQNIPLHDHPHMHGLIKCIEGSLKITSYSKVVNILKLLIAERSMDIKGFLLVRTTARPRTGFGGRRASLTS